MDREDIQLKEVSLYPETWLGFIKALSALEIPNWKDKYIDPYVCDGTQWELVIRLPKRKMIKRYGSNAYPPCWKKLLKVIQKYIDERSVKGNICYYTILSLLSKILSEAKK